MASHRRVAALPSLLVMFSLALAACASKAPPADAAASASGASAALTAQPAGASGAAAPLAPATSEFDSSFLAGGTAAKTPAGLEYVDLVAGEGAALAAGSIAVIDYTAWIGDGREFDSSKARPESCFMLGGPRTAPFFNEGLAGMKAGGKRRFRVPPQLGFGAAGRPPAIPPNSTLLFEVVVNEIRPGAVKPDLSAVKLKQNPSGLKWADLAVGTGEEVKEGGTAMMHYSGFLEDGTKFDSSLDRCQTFPVKSVGKAPVIAGWNEGLVGMKQGGRRVLVCPPDLAYGPAGRPPSIPANATLTFVIEAVSVMAPPPPTEPMNFPDLSTLKLTANPSGLKWADVRVGTGAEVKKGSTAAMHYTGWLESGSKFDSSLDRGETFDVANVGNAGVIAGWNEGLQGMKQGGRRVLVIPASLGYGERGFPPVIPANATLVFMIDAVQVTP